MALRLWSDIAVVSALEGSGRLDLYAVRAAGDTTPALRAEAYDAAGMVAAGELQVWELNQAIAALLSRTSQARRLVLRDAAGRHGGYLDVVQERDEVEVLATASDGSRRVGFATTTDAFARDLATLLHHYLAMTRSGPVRTIVLPDVQPASARATLMRPAP